MTRDERAVFYPQEDYLSVWRRLLIDAIDMMLVITVSVVLTVAVMLLVDQAEHSFPLIFAIWLLVWFGYFVGLKGSSFRTAGYLAAGARIVNLQGERPSRLALTGRLMFVLVGPFNFFVDLLWLSNDAHRQALRDKFVHTYVIRDHAQPAGVGRIAYSVTTIFGATLLLAEVQPDAGAH
ncbi:MAG TPA: RDD family protein [Thermoanaerobaculia bacterium]|nr:RDD family protein [Thermoanaerobaculia bacterium]